MTLPPRWFEDPRVLTLSIPDDIANGNADAALPAIARQALGDRKWSYIPISDPRFVEAVDDAISKLRLRFARAEIEDRERGIVLCTCSGAKPLTIRFHLRVVILDDDGEEPDAA